MAKIPTVYLEVRADTGRVKKNMNEAQKAFLGFKKTINKGGSRGMLSRGLGGLGAQLAAAGAAIISVQTAYMALSSTISNVRTFQKLSAMLKTATGSAEQAGMQFGSLRKLASTLPVTLDEIVGSFIRLKNLGLDPSERALKSYTNTSLAMGKSLDQFIEAVADASVMEFERLKEFGIKAKNQGETIDFIFRGVTTSVENNAKKIEEFLIGLGETEFAGSVADQMDNIDTKLTMLQDAWFTFTAEAGKGKLAQALGSIIDEGTNQLNAATRNMLEKGVRQKIEDEVDLDLTDLETLKSLRETISQKGLKGYGKTLKEAVDSAIAQLENQILINDVMAQQQKSLQERDDLYARQEQGLEAVKNLHIEQAEIEAEGLQRIEILQKRNVSLYKKAAEIREKLKLGEFDETKLEEILEDYRELFETIRDNKGEIKETGDELNKAAEAGKKFGEDLARGLARSVIQGDNLRDTLKNILTELAITGITESLSKPFGGFFSNLFKASGGPVTSDRSYIVGERGPELFTPSTSGNITPNHRMAGGGGKTINVVNNFDINGDREELQRLIAGSVSTSVSLAVSKIQDDKARGVT